MPTAPPPPPPVPLLGAAVLTAFRETFSFVLTTTSSAKEHAYCRRSFREASVDCLCIMSERPSFNLFSQILDLVEERWSDESSMHVLVPLLSAIQQQPFPAPGHRIDLQLYTQVGEPDDACEPSGEVEQMCLYRPSGNDYILDYVCLLLPPPSLHTHTRTHNLPWRPFGQRPPQARSQCLCLLLSSTCLSCSLSLFVL